MFERCNKHNRILHRGGACPDCAEERAQSIELLRCSPIQSESGNPVDILDQILRAEAKIKGRELPPWYDAVIADLRELYKSVIE